MFSCIGDPPGSRETNGSNFLIAKLPDYFFILLLKFGVFFRLALNSY